MATQVSDPFGKHSAWRGLETRYRQYLSRVSPINTILEVGCDYGFSLFTMARDFPEAKVYGVDNYEVAWEHADAEQWVRDHLPAFPNAELVKADGLDMAKIWTKPLDLVHLDAVHDYVHTKALFDAWMPHVRPGGCIMLHDVDSDHFPETRRFFEELRGEKALCAYEWGLGFWYKP